MKSSALRTTTSLPPPNMANDRHSSSTSASSARSPSASVRCTSGRQQGEHLLELLEVDERVGPDQGVDGLERGGSGGGGGGHRRAL